MDPDILELRGFIRDPKNVDELLHNRRLYEEFVFKYEIYLANVVNSHTFFNSYGPIQLGHFRDVSNKCTSIYFLKGRTQGNKSAIPSVHRYISEQWFEGNIHNKDITFQRFFAKIVLMSPSYEIDHCVELHKIFCRKFDGRRKNRILSLKSKDNHKVAKLRSYDPALETEDPHDSKDYRITSLFRSVMIIMRDCKLDVPAAERKVLLMRVGIKNGLVLSFNFDGVEQVEDDDPDFIPPINSIITTLREAVAFIMRLHKSFESVFPSSNERNTGTFITDSGKSVSLTTAEEIGYGGREVVGPSTNWVNPTSENIPHNCYKDFCHASYAEMRDGFYDEDSEARIQREPGAPTYGPSSQLTLPIIPTPSFSISTNFDTRMSFANIANDLFSISHDVSSATR
ncbi:uncharacterized protein EAF01_000484 [Botrytis porri]|uniref:Uncharacterized protein n=1 Tax=Botrytis porri TaxID=87229 RepID=A0A4Z1KCY9_9HELO|nr:uncharacterized protein EAF01_000484 [Botrytis porri]KAF7914078.1 hypothetical protein EAF01_000484 [Botrytis porri]TGO82052.1 hypothetical protein BPOR_0934g00010 [Botrytis porri]